MTERNIDRLLALMARLRDPNGGCPWDLEQSYKTIAPHTIEEAYEVVDAIEKGDMDELRDELGDLLFQVIYYAQFAQEEGRFDFNDVAGAIADKMISRHPHVFGAAEVRDAEQQTSKWEDHKAAERAAKAAKAGTAPSALDGVTPGLPGLTRAVKLQRRAARVGFDWARAVDILDKVAEETDELRHEIDSGAPKERMQDELGDLLFVLANLARRLDIDPEAALRGTNAKFERRFRRVEALLAEQGAKPEAARLAEMETLWLQAKTEERGET